MHRPAASIRNRRSIARYEGDFKIRTPYFVQINTAFRWSDEFNPNDDPVMYGYLSPRNDRKAVVGLVDGHTTLLTAEQLKDMQRWANWATAENWTVPPAPQNP